MHYYSVHTSINTLVWNWLFSEGFFFFMALYNLLQAVSSQLAIREVRATTAMRESSMKQINIRASHKRPFSKRKTEANSNISVFLLFFLGFFFSPPCFVLFFGVLYGCRVPQPRARWSFIRVTSVSGKVDRLRRRRARLIIHFLPQGKTLHIAVARHSTGFYMITL